MDSTLVANACKLAELGFSPIPVHYKRPIQDDWLDTPFDPKSFKGKNTTGIGLLTGIKYGDGGLYAIDVDVHNSVVADEIMAFLQDEGFSSPIRYGAKPKFLLPIILPEAGKKKQQSAKFVDETGALLQIELLGAGQQFVGYGSRDEETSYQWDKHFDLVAWAESKRQRVAPKDFIQKLFNRFKEICLERGYQKPKKDKSTIYGDDMADELTKSMGTDLDAITAIQERTTPRELLQFILSLDKKHYDPDDRDQWIEVGQIIHHFTDGSETGYEVWSEWSSQSDKWDDGKDASPEKVWSGFGHGGGPSKTIFSLVKFSSDPDLKLLFSSAGDKVFNEKGKKLKWPDSFVTDKGTKVILDTEANVEALIAWSEAIVSVDAISGRFRMQWKNEELSFDPFVNSLRSEGLRLGAKFTKENLNSVVRRMLDKQTHNPVLDEIAGYSSYMGEGNPIREWINTQSCFLEHDIEWVEEVLHMTFIQSMIGIRRASDPEYFPNFALDIVPVLTGPQGAGKTRFLESLCPRVPGEKTYSRRGAHLDPKDKDSVWLGITAAFCELGEIDSTFNRSEISRLKAFISQTEDKVRRPYSRDETEKVRCTVFTGSVNDEDFLVDETGNRRFWPIEVTGNITPLKQQEREDIWGYIRDMVAAAQGAADQLVYKRSKALEGTLSTKSEAHKVHTQVDTRREAMLNLFNFDAPKEAWVNKLTATTIIKMLEEEDLLPRSQFAPQAVPKVFKSLGMEWEPKGTSGNDRKTKLWGVPPLKSATSGRSQSDGTEFVEDSEV